MQNDKKKRTVSVCVVFLSGLMVLLYVNNLYCVLFINHLCALFSLLAIEFNKKYSKAFMKRARAYEQLNRKEECLQGDLCLCDTL